jgi:hypothetical protein
MKQKSELLDHDDTPTIFMNVRAFVINVAMAMLSIAEFPQCYCGRIRQTLTFIARNLIIFITIRYLLFSIIGEISIHELNVFISMEVKTVFGIGPLFL